jgi:hypothetical protein
VGKLAVSEAAERPYQQAVDHLAGGHGIGVGKELLERLVQTVGDWWLEQDRRQTQAARADRAPAVSETEASRCVVFADGVMVHSDGAWREARVGTVRSECADGRTCKSSMALLDDTESFGWQLWNHACRRGYAGASVRAFVADGSHWLWNLADRHFGSAVKIVDFWHVCEHVSKCGRAFFGEGSDEARSWSLAVCGMLRAGQVEAALGRVEQLNPRSSRWLRDEKHELVTYLRNNRARMDYPAYEAMGLPIGSGEVEAQCKTLVQQRCKQAGMRWSRSGLEPLLRVRAAVRDGRYERTFGRWGGNVAAWQQARKRIRRTTAA